MRPYQANLLNSIILILMPLWAYLTFDGSPENPTPSITILIPLFFGVILLFCSIGLKKENKMLAHIAVLITLITLIALIVKPLPAAIEDEKSLSIIRIAAMILTSSLAMVAFVKSFIKARRDR